MKPRMGDVYYSPLFDQLRVVDASWGNECLIDFGKTGGNVVPVSRIQRWWIKVGRL